MNKNYFISLFKAGNNHYIRFPFHSIFHCLIIFMDNNWTNERISIPSTRYTVCPRSSYQLYIVPYYIKWATTSWTYSIILRLIMHFVTQKFGTYVNFYRSILWSIHLINLRERQHILIILCGQEVVTHFIWMTTSWTDGTRKELKYFLNPAGLFPFY